MEFYWDTDYIMQSKLSKKNKKIILGELKKELSKNDSALRTLDKIPLKELIRLYNIQKTGLDNISPELFRNLERFTQEVSSAYLTSVCFNETNITPELLTNISKEFYKQLNDPEILSIIEKIYDPTTHLFRIEKEQDNKQISEYVKGRVHKDIDNGLVIGSVYTKGNLLDIAIFNHETGHMISGLLFGKDINPAFYYFLKEVESYYFELLIGYFVKDKYKLEESSKLFRLYRLSSAAKTVYPMKIQDLIVANKTKDISIINEQLLPYKIQIEKEGINESLRNDLYTAVGNLNSYIIALELVKRTLDDPEFGLYSFKQLLTSKKEDLKNILDESKIDITDMTNLQNEVASTKTLLR